MNPPAQTASNALNVVRAIMIRRAKPDIDLEALLEELAGMGDDNTDPCLLGVAQAALKGWIISKPNGVFQVTAAGVAATRRSNGKVVVY